jgi:CheY-like chemotaxis protein
MPTILLLDSARRRLPEGPSWLSTSDITLRDAGTAEEILKAAAANRPALVIADLERNPEATLEAVRALRADPATHGVPFLILAPRDCADEVRHAGAVHVLTGEAGPDVVLAEVRRLLDLFERAAPRVPVDAPVALWRDGHPTEGRLTNISSSGFFTATGEPQPVGARLEMSFRLPRDRSSKVDRSGKIVTGEVIVVRRAPGEGSGFGARFFRLSENARRLIDTYLASRTMRAGKGSV